MYSIRYVCQISGENKSRIYSPRPFRAICLSRDYVLALRTVFVELCGIAIRCGGIDLDGVGYLVAIHWLGEVDLELDGFCRGQPIVVSRKKFGDHWSGRFVFILMDKYFVAPSSKRELWKAAGKWLLGVIV